MATRADVIAAARSYIKTPFVHQGRMKGRGLDCVGLILSVGEDLNLLDKTGAPIRRDDYTGYAAQPSDAFVRDEMKRRLNEQLRNDLQPGFAVAIKLPYFPCHAGFLTERNGVLYMCHALSGLKYEVTEHRVDEQWRSRFCGVFSLPGVE